MSKSKGPKPPPNQPPPQIRDPVIVCEPPSEECWTFTLVETTSSAANVEPGSTVAATIHDNRVLINGGRIALGFAPDSKAQEMTMRASETQRSLKGIVLAAGTNNGIVVRLCLS